MDGDSSGDDAEAGASEGGENAMGGGDNAEDKAGGSPEMALVSMAMVWGKCWHGDNIVMRVVIHGDGIEMRKVLLIDLGCRWC